MKAILFDLDDTLLDRATSVDCFLPDHHRRMGLDTIPFATYRERFHVLDRHGYYDRVTLFEELISELGLATAIDAMHDDFRRHAWLECRLFPDARDVLCTLRESGYALGIITNGAVESQRVKLETSGVLDYVDVALIAGDEDISKPDPAIFQRAAARLGVEPAECVFVGDHPRADIEGAAGAGMSPVWLKRHLPWPDDLVVPRMHTIVNLSDVIPLLPPFVIPRERSAPPTVIPHERSACRDLLTRRS